MASIIASCMVTLSMARDIKAAYRFYRLQSSTASVPSKPTSIDPLPPSGWSDTEPSYTEGSTYTLYTVDLTVFSDDTFSYSPVSISSSYEAAKQAYNKALVNASNIASLTTTVTTNTTDIQKNANAIALKAESSTVTKLRDDFESLDIGARNLVLKTSEPKTATCPVSTTNGAYTPTYHISEYAAALITGADAGDIYTASFDWIQTGESTAGNLQLQLRNVDCVFPDGTPSMISFSDSNNSGHSELQVSLLNTQIIAASDFFRIRISETSGSGPATITISNVKFEKGNTGTDWTPAPEDILAEANEYTSSQISALEITADGISSSVTSLTESLNALRDEQADLEGTVTENANSANQMITALRSLIDQNAETISATIQTMNEQGSWIAQAALWLTANGLHLQTSTTSTIFNADGEGVRITKSDGTVVAEFTNSNSAVDYLKVRTHLSFGAHRGEMIEDTDFDGTTSEGTAFFWIGDVI